MKRFQLAIFALISILSAGEFEDAEALFQQGRFKECDEVIGKMFEIKLSAPQKLKLQAMREYIWGNNPDKIAENVQKAQEIAAHLGWLTDDLLNHSTLLIRRAEDWKSRGIPEYQELSNAAAKLLAQLKDGGNPEIAIKQVILQTRNFNLNGEYNEPVKLIHDVLRLYYPAKRASREKKSSGEIELLILLGEQYAGLGVATRNEREKVNALSSAAKYYLQAVEHLPIKSTRYRELSDRLCFYRETMRLLGYHLQLPEQIKPQKSTAVAMFDEMLHSRRFHDAVIALEAQKTPELQLRYAFGLTAIGQSDKAVAVIRELKEFREPHFLLLSARNALSANEKDEAAFLFQRFLELSPDSPDAPAAVRQYVSILMEQKKYEQGAAFFLRLADLSTDPIQQNEVRFQAAQCFYQAEKYDECIGLFPQTSPIPERNLLLAQAKIKIKDEQGALILLRKILEEKSLSGDLGYHALQLAIFCALKTNQPEAEQLLNEISQRYPNNPDMPEYARHLLTLYQERKATSGDFIKLSNQFWENAPNHPDAVAFVLACAQNITNQTEKEKLLCRLLMRPDYSVSELNALLKCLPTLELKRKFLNRYKKPFQNTPELCELYFLMIEMEMALKNNKNALTHLNLLLAQPEVFRYTDCMSMRIEINAGSGHEEAVRKDCRELLLTGLSVSDKRRIVLQLAQSWERSGNSKKAIATAWTAIPLTKSMEPYVQDLLALIIRNAKTIGSQTDLQDAQDLQ